MKILHTVENYSESGGGMFEVVKQISEHLLEFGHEVTIASNRHALTGSLNKSKIKIRRFEIDGNDVRGYSSEKSVIEEYQKFLIESGFDVITNFAAQQWATDLTFPVLSRINAKKVFVPTGFSGLFLPQYKDYFEKMRYWMTQYDMNVFLSHNYRDINFARENKIKNTCIIPNGASAEEFSKPNDNDIRSTLCIPRDHVLILHVGSHTGHKGHKEAIQIFRASRIKRATLLIIGNIVDAKCYKKCMFTSQAFNFREKIAGDPKYNLFKRRKKSNGFITDGVNKQILIMNLKRSDTVKAYHDADLFLFPSNIECSPIVLFECAASGTPFLSSDAGNATEIAQWTGGGMILPTIHKKNGFCTVNIRESAAMLEDVMADHVKRSEMANTSYQRWKENYSWEKIAMDYEHLYLDLMKNNDRKA